MKARHKDTGEIIELAEEGIISRDGRRFCWYQVELIPEPIDECKPSLPSNLDEAAENRVTENGRFKITSFEKMRIDDIMFGAEWMAGQGETFNGYISVKGKRSLIAIEGKSDMCKFGDKVVVQIRKK